ncbi:hypothetical protein C8Q70DRAFT_236193 [Cubamyces menziesii]|nr:hypothetical protein C8Q70DRAFT_236193 [Cubamyces menziesii]
MGTPATGIRATYRHRARVRSHTPAPVMHHIGHSPALEHCSASPSGHGGVRRKLAGGRLTCSGRHSSRIALRAAGASLSILARSLSSTKHDPDGGRILNFSPR